jgi:hypothetical protein
MCSSSVSRSKSSVPGELQLIVGDRTITGTMTAAATSMAKDDNAARFFSNG